MATSCFPCRLWPVLLPAGPSGPRCSRPIGKLLCPGEQRGPQIPRGISEHNPSTKGTLVHPHNHSTVYSEHLLCTGHQSHRRCNTLRAMRALHVGIPGGQQRQGQMPERKGQGQLSSGRRRGHRLRALDKGGRGCNGREEAERLLEVRKGQTLSEGNKLLNRQRQGGVTGSGGIPGEARLASGL